MKKRNLLLVTSLLSTTLLFGCNNTGNSNSSASTETTSKTESGTSSKEQSEFIRTEKLDDAMFAELKKGYQVEFFQTKDYEASSKTVYIYDAKVNENNYDLELFSTQKETPDVKYARSGFYHFQPKQGEEPLMLYDASLSIGNEVLYTPVVGEDIYTYEEIQVTWEDAHLSNVFIDLAANMFVRVGDENKFQLSIEGLEEAKRNEIYEKLSAQLYGLDLFMDSYSVDLDPGILTDTTVASFYLLTNGNQITGFELNYDQFNSFDSTILCSSKGSFLASGADVTSDFQVLEGQEDAEFEAAIASLQKGNFHLEETQSRYDYQTEKMVSSGSYTGDFYNNEAFTYNYYTPNGMKYMNYGYSRYTQEGQEYQLGFVNIEDKYYADCLYGGTLDELLPSFKLSSKLFKKDESSTADKKVYKLNKDIQISLHNYASVISPLDADGYFDRLVNLTVTVESDKINIHNETTDSKDSGLILDINYTNIGKVEKFLTEDKLLTSTEGLTWSQILSNNEANMKVIEKVFTKAVLDDIPVLTYSSLVYSDVSASSKPVIFFTFYEEADGAKLMEEFATKLAAANYTLSNASTEENPTYIKNVTVNNRQYQLNVSYLTQWNASAQWGQFQIQLSFSKAQ